MKKIINQPDNYIKEMLEGIYIAHKDDLACVDGDLQVLVSKHKKEGKVGIVTGGGSGHLPLFLGYVGKGMIDGCAVGDVFQSPSVDQAIALTRDADQGAGVLYIYGNYNGDIFTFRPAADEVEMEDDIETAEVFRSRRCCFSRSICTRRKEHTSWCCRNLLRIQMCRSCSR